MTEPKQRRKPRKYTDEFKQQLVELYCSQEVYNFFETKKSRLKMAGL